METLCEAADMSGERRSRLSMLSTRKVMVKASTHLARVGVGVRVRVRGRGRVRVRVRVRVGVREGEHTPLRPSEHAVGPG